MGKGVNRKKRKNELAKKIRERERERECHKNKCEARVVPLLTCPREE